MLLFTLSKLNNNFILDTLYSYDWFKEKAVNWIPTDYVIHYGEEIIANERFLLKGPHSGGTISSVASPNSVIEYNFEGTKIEWVGILNRYLGVTDVIIDNKKSAQIDLHSKATQNKQNLFESDRLSPGPHTLKLVATGQKNPRADGYGISVDYFQVWNGEESIRVEDDNPEIKYLNPNQYYYIQFILRKLVHISGYFSLTLILFLFTKRFLGGWMRILFVLLTILCIAGFDEFMQQFSKGRHANVLDVLVDCAGILLALLLIYLVSFLRSLYRLARGDNHRK